MAGSSIRLLYKLVEWPAFTEIGIGILAKLTWLGGTGIVIHFAMKMIHWGLPGK
jgi:hypothetical protein